MSSVGASFAQVYVQQKKHEDKLKKKKKKMDEERETSGDATAAAIEIGSCKPGKSNKIHPGAGTSALSLNYKKLDYLEG
ncbi:hypothetical protein ACSBR1_024976 [Camellia fascicularis]